MAYKPREVEEKLQNKFGFARDKDRGSDHRYYILEIEGLPLIRTHFSHARKKDIGAVLESKIVKQLHVRKKYFKGMIDCTNSREDYYHQLQKDPFPPFE